MMDLHKQPSQQNRLGDQSNKLFSIPHAMALAASAISVIGLSASIIRADPPVSGYQLLWSSQFNGNTINPLKWNFGQPWGSNVPPSSNSIGEPGNVTVSNNTLSLTAQNQSTSGYGYTTGLVNTSGLLNFTYGYVEAQIQVPYTLGTWPAFWMLQNGWPPEIDVMEVPQQSYNNQAGSVGTAYDYYATYHYTDSSGNAASAGSGMYYTGVNEATSFNDYGMMWTPNAISFYFNGNLVDTVTSSQANIAQAKNMYLLLDLAVGGWPGNPPSWAAFPTTMQIKNVNVWQLPSTSNMTMNWTGNGTASWNSGSSWQNGSIPTLGSESAVFGQTSASANQVQWNNFQTAGNLTFNGGTTNYSLGELGTSGLMLANDTGTASITANAYQGHSDSISIASELDLYNSTNMVNNMSNAIQIYGNIYGEGALNIQNGGVDIHSAVTNTGGINVDNGGNIILSDGSINTPANDVNLSTAAGSNASMTVLGASSSVDARVFRVGGYNGGSAAFTQNAGTVASQTWFVIGQSGAASGQATINGGTLVVRAGGGTSGDLELGVFNSASGVLNINGTGTVALLNNSNIVMGSQGTSGNGTVNENAGNVGFYSDNGTTAGGTGAVILGRNGSTGVYTYNLAGGVLETSQIESSSGTSNFTFNGGTLKADENNAAFMQGLSNASIGSNGGTINSNGFNISIGQNISGTGALNITGGGTLTLSGNNTYSGGTTVAETTLLVANTTGSATGTGAVTISTGGLLGGTGAISVPVSTAAGGTLSPGASDPGGTLTIVGPLTIGDSTHLDYYFSAPSGGANSNSFIAVTGNTGNLTLGKNVTIALQPGSTLTAGVYHLISYSGQLNDLSGDFTGWTLSGVDLPGMMYSFSTQNSANNLDLVVSAVPTPEPATLALFTLGAMGLLIRRSRRSAKNRKLI
jgi:autotransporter-associated beta strand protein